MRERRFDISDGLTSSSATTHDSGPLSQLPAAVYEMASVERTAPSAADAAG